MPVIALPYNPQPHETNDITQVMADFTQLTQLVNGGLDADNVQTGAPPNPLTGNANGIGVLAALARADHTHTIQGMEQLTADPSTGNFVGREYVDTTNKRKRLCIDAAGTGTWVTSGNLTAAELVAHAAEHKDGGHDPLADNTLTDHMKAARVISSATMGSDVTNISSSGYVGLVQLTLTAPGTTGIQTILVLCTVSPHNASGSDVDVYFRVVDITAASATIWRSPNRYRLSGTSVADTPGVVQFSFYYNVPAGGARTLALQAGASAANVTMLKPAATLNSEAFQAPNMQAVIV